MRRTARLTIAALLLAAPASAGPLTIVTGGAWTATLTPELERDKSEDDGCASGPRRCAAVWFLPPGTEELIAGFGILGYTGGTLVGRLTDYPEGWLDYDGLSFTYDNRRGFASSSWQAGIYQRLYRLLTPMVVQYWLMVEDLPAPGYVDRNDYMVTFLDLRMPPGDRPFDPPPVPEPAASLVCGLGLLLASLARRVCRPRRPR